MSLWITFGDKSLKKIHGIQTTVLVEKYMP